MGAWEHCLQLLQNHILQASCIQYRTTKDKKLSCRYDSRRYCLKAPLGSRDVIGHVTISYPLGHFLLVVLWNGVSIPSLFLDILLCVLGSRV